MRERQSSGLVEGRSGAKRGTECGTSPHLSIETTAFLPISEHSVVPVWFLLPKRRSGTTAIRTLRTLWTPETPYLGGGGKSMPSTRHPLPTCPEVIWKHVLTNINSRQVGGACRLSLSRPGFSSPQPTAPKAHSPRPQRSSLYPYGGMAIRQTMLGDGRNC